MDDRPLVSVVVTAYNYGRYVRAAVASVLAQTYDNLEILVVDDGSTDDTPSILAEYARAGRIRYLRQDNAGQARAKNRGIAESRGRLVAFLDADDQWLPRKIEKQVPLFADARVGVVCSKRAIILADDSLFPNPPHTRLQRGDVLGPVFARNFVPFSTAVVRRSCFDQVGVFDESLGMGIDYDLWIRMAARWHFDFVDEELALYRYGHGQMSRNVAKRVESNWRIIRKTLDDPALAGRIARKYVRQAFAETLCVEAECKNADGRKLAAAGRYLKAARAMPARYQTWAALAKLFISQDLVTKCKNFGMS
ncbi:MAG: glycosyltransferase family 2 protein [Opitutae bacterium]|nr:glycosyltransferase family 2 protein [Opitutae bacterium]